jgi:transcriptional regulator with XRE-family HTH domain
MSALVDEVRSRPKAPARQVAQAIRVAAGVSQSRLAEELGVHQVTVARWECGMRSPRGETLRAYVALLAELQTATVAP